MKQVKICGLFREEDIQYVNTYQPQYIGFVFAQSKRQVTLEKAKYLRSLLVPNIKAVGVFVNEEIDRLVAVSEYVDLDVVQLHGQEDNEYIQQLKKRISIPVIKAIAIKNKEDIQNINYDVDFYLLDGAKSGSGEPFDWRYIKRLNKPYFLAGGISLGNIEEAMQIPSYGIDVSSGVETNQVKDQKKIQELIRRIKDESR